MVFAPLLKAPVRVSDPPFPVVKKRFVVDAVVVKSVVEVALVVVLFNPVKFWRVEEPVRRILAKVVVLLNELVPVKELLPEKVLLLASRVEEAVLSAEQPKSPPVQVRKLPVVQVVRFAPLKLAVKSLEELAVVAKKLVEVAFVEVDWRAVKFWRVVEEFARS